jgi:hypothetical protein
MADRSQATAAPRIIFILKIIFMLKTTVILKIKVTLKITDLTSQQCKATQEC